MMRILCRDNLNVTLRWTVPMINKINVIKAIRSSQIIDKNDGPTYNYYKYGLIETKYIADRWSWDAQNRCDFLFLGNAMAQKNWTIFVKY